jgi:MFS family permease
MTTTAHIDSAATYPPRRYAWSVVGILIATAILSYTDRQVLTLLVDPIRNDLGLNDASIGLLIGSAFAIIYGIAGIPLGYLADRVSRRNLLMAGVIIWSLATIACGLARDFNELFTARIFVGLGEAVLSPAAISLISDLFPSDRRGTAVGLFLSGIAMGIGSAILIGGSVLHAVDVGLFTGSVLNRLPAWRLVLLLIGLPGLAWSLVLLFIKEPTRQSSIGMARSQNQPSAASTFGISDIAGVVPIYLVVGMASLVDNAVGAWSPSLLIRGFAKDPATVGVELGIVLTACFGGGVFLGGLLSDRLSQTGGLARKLQLCLAVSAVIVPTCLLLLTSLYTVVLWAIALYFGLSGMVTAMGFSALLDRVPSHSRALALAISFFFNVAVGGAIGPAAVPLAATYLFGEARGLGPPIVLTAVGGYTIVLLALLLTLWRKPQQPLP